MWPNKEQQSNPPSPSSSAGLGAPSTPGISPTDPIRPAGPNVRGTAWIGPSLEIKGSISGSEDLLVEGKVDGPISLEGHKLTVGGGAAVTAEIVAREIVVYGKVDGDLLARDRIEIKKDGTVTGDLNTARIMIEDGAYFKGNIEIERSGKRGDKGFEGPLTRPTDKIDKSDRAPLVASASSLIKED